MAYCHQTFKVYQHAGSFTKYPDQKIQTSNRAKTPEEYGKLELWLVPLKTRQILFTHASSDIPLNLQTTH
jgi:hypothetical protein